MNITLLGHYDIASLFALNRLIELLPQHRYTAFLSRSPLPATKVDSPLEQLAFADAALCEQFLSRQLGGPVAVELSAPRVAELDRPNSSTGCSALAETQPDLLVSIRYRRILREEAIAIPRHGVLNLHSGILPDYRGVMATFWAMLNGEKEIGTTLHWIVDAGIDTGPVIGIQRQATRPSRSYLTNVIGLYVEGCDMLAKALHIVAAGAAPSAEPQTAAGRYFHAPEDKDIQRFESSGLALIDRGEEAEISAQRQPEIQFCM